MTEYRHDTDEEILNNYSVVLRKTGDPEGTYITYSIPLTRLKRILLGEEDENQADSE